MDVLELRDDQVDEAGRMLGRAFQGDALLAYMLPDAEERARLAAAHFTPFVRMVRAGGVVWTTPEVAAVACWRRPGEHDPAPSEVVASGLDRIADVVGAAAWARVSGVFDALDERRRALAIPDHWYLALAGVEPSRQGTGLGSAVVRAGLDEADARGAHAYLETLEARNVPFYERFGFRTVEDAVEPVSGLRYWLMLREPYGRVD